MLTAVQMMLGVADTPQNDERVLAAVTRRYNYPLEVSAAALADAKRRVAVWRQSGNGSLIPASIQSFDLLEFIMRPLYALAFLLRVSWRLVVVSLYVTTVCCVIALLLEAGQMAGLYGW